MIPCLCKGIRESVSWGFREDHDHQGNKVESGTLGGR